MKHSFFLGGGTFPPLKTHDMKTKHNIVTPIAPTTKHQNSRTQHHKISRKRKKKKQEMLPATHQSWPSTCTHSIALHTNYKNLENIQQEINQIFI